MRKLLILIFGIILFFAGCDEKKNSNIEEKRTIKIGGLLALTGSASQWGKNCKDGIELAVEQLNSFNKNIHYKVIYQDTKGKARISISAFHKLKSEKIKFIIGDVSSNVNLAIAPLADKEKIIVISPAATSPKLTNAGQYTFRTWNSDIEEAVTMANYCKSNSIDSITLLLINNDYGIGLKNAFEREVKNSSVKINKILTFEPDTKNFRPYLLNIDKSTEALYIIGYPNELYNLFRNIRELNIKQILLGTSVFDDPILKNINLKNKIFYAYPKQTNNNSYKLFVKKFIERYGIKPGIAADTAYDAMMIIDKVINKKEPLKSMYEIKNFEGASGLISFDKNGDVHKPMVIHSFH